MTKFNMGLANHLLDKKIENYLTQPDFATPVGGKSEFTIVKGLASFKGVTICFMDYANNTLLTYDIPEGSPKYSHIIKHRIIKKASELNIKLEK